MLETIKTVAVIVSASVAFCAFVVGMIHYLRILVKKIKENRAKRLMTKDAKKKEAELKESLYQAFIKAQKEAK